jgi:hypothetical protein
MAPPCIAPLPVRRFWGHRKWVFGCVDSFRVIVVEDGTRTIQLVMGFERPPYEGDVVELPDGLRVTVRHVISATREGLAGVVLAWVPNAA